MSLLMPIGAFLTQFTTAITTAEAAATSGVVSKMPAILVSMMVIYLAIDGWKNVAGDTDRFNLITFTLVKLGTIFMLATNQVAFNTWVVGVFQHGIPDAISQAVVNGNSDSTVSSVSGVAGAMDKLWAKMWAQNASVLMTTSMVDVSSRLIAEFTIFLGSAGLVLIAGVYLLSIFLFAIIMPLGPVAIACAMFPATRPIFERWIGKGVALIVLQVTAVITMQIVLSGANSFVSAPTASVPDLPTQLQNMISMVIYLSLGAFAIYSLPAVAYSIGTGVTISMGPIVSKALSAVTLGAGGAAAALASGASSALPGGSGSGPAPDINLSMARAAVAGGSSSSDASFFGPSGASSDGSDGPRPLIPPNTPLLPYGG